MMMMMEMVMQDAAPAGMANSSKSSYSRLMCLGQVAMSWHIATLRRSIQQVQQQQHQME